MYILVTDPEKMAQGLRRTFYVMPENESDTHIYQEHNLYVQEAEEMEKNDKWGASVARERAAKILLRIWQDNDTTCEDVVSLMKPAYQGSRVQAIALVSKLFRGVARGSDMKKFNESKLRRLNDARMRMKRIQNNGAAWHWERNLLAGRAS